MLEHGARLGVIAGGGEIRPARAALHHDAARVVAETVDVGHGQALGLEHLQHAHLVLEGVDAVVHQTPVSSEVDRQRLAIALDLQVIGGSPALVLLGGRHPASHQLLDVLECALPLG